MKRLHRKMTTEQSDLRPSSTHESKPVIYTIAVATMIAADASHQNAKREPAVKKSEMSFYDSNQMLKVITDQYIQASQIDERAEPAFAVPASTAPNFRARGRRGKRRCVCQQPAQHRGATTHICQRQQSVQHQN